MKQIFTLVIAMAITAASFAQSTTITSTFSGTISGPGSSWSASGSNFIVSLNSGSSSEFLASNAFDLSNIPANAKISSITVTISRRASGSGIADADLSLRAGTTVYSAADATAASSSWPTNATPVSTTYTFPQAFVDTLTVSVLKNSGMSIVLRTTNTSGSTRTATVSNSISMSISWLTLAPIILTDFAAVKNADNQVELRFATSSEENVQNLYVQRSGNGKDFENLFTIAPKGARNVYTKYNVVDKTPLQGNNYYRIAEMDKNGRWYYYTTKLVNVDSKSKSFSAYYNGGQVVANISNAPGQYELSMVDMSGVSISRKMVTMTGKSAQVMLDAPSRPGIYVVILKGQGTAESTRVAIVK